MKCFLTFLVCLVFFSATAQTFRNKKLDDNFIKFFEGNWVGVGKFASGKKIEATVSFKLSLDSCWMIYTHEDKQPNHYKAVSMWGLDKPTGKFLAYIFDNFQGHRLFKADGWLADSLAMVNKEAANGGLLQRFTYVKTGAAQFKMSYETSKDSINWKLGDALIFNKQPDQ